MAKEGYKPRHFKSAVGDGGVSGGTGLAGSDSESEVRAARDARTPVRAMRAGASRSKPDPKPELDPRPFDASLFAPAEGANPVAPGSTMAFGSRRGRGAGVVRRWFTSPGRHHVLSALLWFVSLAILTVMALRFAPYVINNGRKIPSLAAFIPWLAIPSAILLLPAVLWRRRVLTLLVLVTLALQVGWHAGYLNPMARTGVATALSGYADQASADDAFARVMTLNTANGKADAAQVVSIVRDQHVEVLTLQEVTPAFVTALQQAGIGELLPHKVVAKAGPLDNGGVNVVFTLAPMEQQSLNLKQTQSSAVPAASVRVGGRLVRFASVHVASPVRSGLGNWNAGLTALRSLSGSSDAGELVLMGDFNATWDHSRFRKMLGSEFLDASESAGEGLHMTYPANSKVPPMIEIDHIVYAAGAGLMMGDLQTVEIAGTDHLALLGTLAVAGA